MIPPEGPEDNERSFIGGIAALPDGHTLVLINAHPVDEDGRFIMNAPSTRTIERFDAAGGYVGEWGVAGDSDSELSQPIHVESDPSGTILILEEDGRVKQFTADGELLRAWSIRNPDFVQDLAVGPGGVVYVTDNTNSRIESYTAAGTFTHEWGGWDSAVISNPRLAVGFDGSVYVYMRNGINDRIRRYAPDGTILAEFSTGVNFITGIEFDAGGLVYISSFLGNIQTYCVEDLGAARLASVASGPALLPPPDQADIPIPDTALSAPDEAACVTPKDYPAGLSITVVRDAPLYVSPDSNFELVPKGTTLEVTGPYVEDGTATFGRLL